VKEVTSETEKIFLDNIVMNLREGRGLGSTPCPIVAFVIKLSFYSQTIIAFNLMTFSEVFLVDKLGSGVAILGSYNR
jgi:hypothetical protein